MNLNNIEEYVDDIIVGRGYSYYISETIINVNDDEEGEYILNVEGSKIYKVMVKINENGEIKESSCDCPFNFGPICKHEVAAYYHLRDLRKSPIIKGKTRKLNFQELLKEIHREELIKIIIQITDNNENLKQNIIYKYSNFDDTDEVIKFKSLLNSLVNEHIGRDFYIHYNRVYNFAYDMSNLLYDGVEKALTNNNYLLALDIALIAMEECLEAFQYADDSGGSIGMLINEISDKVDDIIIEVIDNGDNKKEEIFNNLLKYMDTKVLEDWQDYRIDLLGICFRFIEEEQYRKTFKKKLMDLIDNEICEFSDYYKEKMLMMQYEIISEYESEGNADLFIEENLKYTSFRELIIKKLQEEGNYLKIIDLTLEAEKKDKDWAGLVSKWKKIRYQAYKSLSLKEEQEKLAKELLLDGKFEYYEELITIHKGNEEALYNEIISQIQEGKNWYWSNLYVKLIVYEKDMGRILEYVKKSPRQIEEYASMLMDEYPIEVIDIYKDHIYSIAKLASDRKRYREVCRSIERFGKFVAKEDINNIIGELSILYRRRPAFLDELSRIKK